MKTTRPSLPGLYDQDLKLLLLSSGCGIDLREGQDTSELGSFLRSRQGTIWRGEEARTYTQLNGLTIIQDLVKTWS